MNYIITEGEVGTSLPVDLPNPEFLKALGEDGMRKLISDHYDLLVQSDIKGLFPPSAQGLEMAKKHSADFFIQICGGPSYFNQSRGAPMMKARHNPFKINKKARRIWLESYILVLKDLDIDEDLKKSFWDYIDKFSIWMMNSTED